MKQFKELGIIPTLQNFVGDKIKMERILNRQITVHDFKIEDSKYEKGNGKCLYMQISIGEIKYVVFSGSSVLMSTIQQIGKEDFPFQTTIVKSNDHFEFS